MMPRAVSGQPAICSTGGRSRYQLIVADGFSDFTRTEHDILQDLAAHAGEMWISLPMEGEGGA